MTLFHSIKQTNQPEDNGRTPRKRGIGYYLEIRCRGKLVQTFLLDDPDKSLTIGRAEDNTWSSRRMTVPAETITRSCTSSRTA